MIADTTIRLALVSHTNVGKTALARTLIGEDVGEVRDGANVTTASVSYPLFATPEGYALTIIDTPGFSDSARLARRLSLHGNPIGWFLESVWDRWRDRPLWLAQQAVRTVRDEADVVLYLVNATETPADTGYLAPELAVLAWMRKPTLVLVNQTGAPMPFAEAAAVAERWRPAVAAHGFIGGVLPLDAFTRCWVQEGVLLDAVAPLLPSAKLPPFRRVQDAIWARRLVTFEQAIATMTAPIVSAVLDRVVLVPPSLIRIGRELVDEMVRKRSDPHAAQTQAITEMAERLDLEVRRSVDELIAMHGLAGRTSGEVLARLTRTVKADRPMHEGKAALVGGFLSGALSGLVADLATGGLTLGAGMLAGGVLGALGGAGVARGVNIVRGRTETTVRWSDAFLDALVVETIMRYLAVAHFGRGRGAWTEAREPTFWQACVVRQLEAREDAFREAWTAHRAQSDRAELIRVLQPLLFQTTVGVLEDLYPGSRARIVGT